MSVIELPRPLVNQLLHRAQLGDTDEVCGLIGQHPDGQLSLYPVDNIANQPQTRFAMDPSGQIAAMRQLSERGESLFAIYHSHPCAEAAPSAEDLQHDEYPDAIRLIISLNTKGVLELRGYRLTHGQAAAVEVILPD